MLTLWPCSYLERCSMLDRRPARGRVPYRALAVLCANEQLSPINDADHGQRVCGIHRFLDAVYSAALDTARKIQDPLVSNAKDALPIGAALSRVRRFSSHVSRQPARVFDCGCTFS